MGLLRYGLILGGLALLAHFIADRLHSKLPLHFDGHVSKGYETVQKAFEQNFIDGWESEGASFAVYVKGQKVVDLWGGYADKQAARLWKEDTISVAFSTTKAVAAVCIAMLADRGRLKYDDLVSKHWPGFAKNGKENITIEWVMSHMAGLPYFDTQITEEMARDHNLMRKVVENETPKRPAGKSSGYHLLTYGWLVDQIVRHADEKHRGIGQFLREEITKPNGIDFHLGLPSSEEYRVARSTLPTVVELIDQVWYEKRVAHQIFNFYMADKNSAVRKAMDNPSWFDVAYKCTVNNPEQHALEQAAATGIGNARSLGAIFNLFVNGHLVGEKTMALLEKPVLNETDYILNVNTVKGHGFFYAQSKKSGNDLMIGHSGHGCQQVIADTKNKVVIAYVTNGLKAGVFDLCRNYMRLQNAVYDALALYTA
uniref:Beta-lactamase-related domain containing protein n=1 Tax=Haemonchus contortus TaxID=6289 RepID=A0A7I4YI41_HAECO